MRLHLLWVLAMRKCKSCSKSLFTCTCRLDFQVRAIQRRQKKQSETYHASISGIVWCQCSHDTSSRSGCCEQLPGNDRVCFCQPPTFNSSN
ncbi:MAG: NosZ-like protein [Circular genetic element sp.]|nr:MAG: NosZ-like protein [Circular genetic element sp.]